MKNITCQLNWQAGCASETLVGVNAEMSCRLLVDVMTANGASLFVSPRRGFLLTLMLIVARHIVSEGGQKSGDDSKVGRG